MIKNVKKILAPVDFSEISMEAMRGAMELAKDVGAEVHLVHIIAPHHTQRQSLPHRDVARVFRSCDIARIELHQD